MQERREKIVAWVAVAFIALFLLAWIFDEPAEPPGPQYMPTDGYVKALGVSEIDYYAFRKAYGKPEEELWREEKETGRVFVTSCYPQFDLESVVLRDEEWVDNLPYLHLMQVKIKEESLRFGRRQIGLGSTREEVQRAYARDRKLNAKYIPEYDPTMDEGYLWDFGRKVLFRYDENGIVTAMTYCNPSN